MTKSVPMGVIVTDRGISLMIDGQMRAINSGHMNYERIVEAAKAKDWDAVNRLSNVTKTVADYGKGKVTIEGGTVKYNGQVVANVLTRRMIQMSNEGWDIDPLIKFLENLMQNPSRTAVEELYLFLESGHMPLTEDGHFLAYKRVGHNYKDLHSGKFDNSVGAVCEMPRNMVDDVRDRTCSYGLHFCSMDYLPNYGNSSGNHVMVVKINPKDVVSIPSDYSNTKGRTCRYEVIAEADLDPDFMPKPLTGSVWSGSNQVADEDEDWDDDWDSDWDDDLEDRLSDAQQLLSKERTPMTYELTTRAWENGVTDGKAEGEFDAACGDTPDPDRYDAALDSGVYGLAFRRSYLEAYIKELSD